MIKLKLLVLTRTIVNQGYDLRYLAIVSVLFEQDKDKKEIIEFINKNGINYPITIGEENFKLAKELGNVQKVPEMFLFSKDGKFIKKFIGKTSKEELEKYIQMAIEN